MSNFEFYEICSNLISRYCFRRQRRGQIVEKFRAEEEHGNILGSAAISESDLQFDLVNV